MENRHLMMNFTVSQATGTAGMRSRNSWTRGCRSRTLISDHGYGTWDCVQNIHARQVPHVVRNQYSAMGGLRRARYRGVARHGAGRLPNDDSLQSGMYGQPAIRAKDPRLVLPADPKWPAKRIPEPIGPPKH